MIQLKTPEEVDAIARGGAIIADFLVEVRPRTARRLLLRGCMVFQGVSAPH